MRYSFALATGLAAAMLMQAAMAQCHPVRRALVVAINTYTGKRPPALRVENALVERLPLSGDPAARPFGNLDGAVNDANDFADLLQSSYDFDEKNVVRLLEQTAAAQNILDTFERHLVEESTCAGDVSVFFYSGHGSQIRNRFVKDESAPDKFDQTLVPYDAADGVPDIRNKELDRLYLKAVKKGISLTVIADSCQSGGLSRGAKDLAKGKDLPPDSRFVVDPGIRDAAGKLVLPTRRSANVAHPVLLLAAAFETEEAKEDLSGEKVHGAFTAALLKKLQDHGQQEAIGAVFDDIKLAVTLQHGYQHPQIYGEGRLESDLFGQPANSTTGMITRVRLMQPDGSYVLDKGKLAGLYEKCELITTSKGSSPVRLIIRESSATQSVATVKEGGNSGLSQGARFRLDRWVVPDESALSLYFAKDGPALEDLARDAKEVAQLEEAGVKVISDPTAPGATGDIRQIWWLNGSWRLLENGSANARDLGKALDGQLLKQLAGRGALYVNFPLPPGEASKLDLGDGTNNDAVRVQPRPEQPRQAQYILAGKWNGKGFEYAWVRPGITEDDQPETNLPVRTDWVSDAETGFATDLRGKALQLNRIYGWVNLDLPGGGTGAGEFPYHLALRKVGATANLQPGKDVTTEGEQYKVWLTAKPEEIAAITQNGNLAQRWVYVLAMDRDGKIDVLIPGRLSDVGNHVPVEGTPSSEIQMTSDPFDFSIGTPFGLDTYILLTSDDEIDPRIFPAKGVRSRSASRGSGNPLADLLGNIGTNSRVRGINKPVVPTTWSVQRITFRSQPAMKAEPGQGK